jgi:predicted nucleotidyltransferase
MTHYKNIKNTEDYIKNIILSEIDSSIYKVFLFGSRTNQTQTTHSDWDIGILGDEKLVFKKILKLKNIFTETPFRVDIIDFKNADENFKRLSLENSIAWN